MKTKFSKLSLISIIVAACLVLSIIGSFIVQTSFFSVKQTMVTKNVSDLVKIIEENNVKNNKNYGKTLTSASQKGQVSFTIYQPRKASKNNKVPLILCCEGNTNTKEMQFMNFIELSKRGFAVVTVDLAGQGFTDAQVKDEVAVTYTASTKEGSTRGAVVALEYAMSLDFVDETRVGATGHSGGNVAIGQVEDKMKAARLEDPTFTKKISAFWTPAGTGMTMAGKYNKDGNLFLLGACDDWWDEVSLAFPPFMQAMFGEPGAKRSWMSITGKDPGETAPYGVFGNKDNDNIISMYDLKAGQSLKEATGYSDGFVVFRTKTTHPGSMFNVDNADLVIRFFYAAFGTPNGYKAIPSSSQTWPIAMAFQILGIIGFFASILVIGAWLLKTKRFKSIVAVEGEVDAEGDMIMNPRIKAQAELPSIKDWREIVPFIATFIPLVFLTVFLYEPAMNASTSRFVIPNFEMSPIMVAYYTFVMGVVSVAMIGFNYVVKKLCYIKNPEQCTPTIFEACCDMLSVRNGMKTLLFAIEVVILAWVIPVIAYYVFDVRFIAAVYGVGIPRLRWLPQIIMVLVPIWFIYTAGNGALNAATRFKEIPEWVSVLFIALCNLIPMVCMSWFIYGYVTTHNQYPVSQITGGSFAGNVGCLSFNLWAPAIYLAISGRYFYKKTGNIWAGAAINATVLALMAATLTLRYSDTALISFV